MALANGEFDAFAGELAVSHRRSCELDREKIERAIAEARRQGRERLPTVDVPELDFARAIGRSVAGVTDPIAALDRLHGADLYVARACVLGAASAIAVFEQSCRSAIEGALRAVGLGEAAVADLAQDVREKLFVDGKIATYLGRASLDSWLRTIATRTAISSLRKRSDASIDDQVMNALPSNEHGPDEEHLATKYRIEFKEAFEQAMASLTPQQRNLLRQRFVDALEVESIGALYGVHKATASRWIDSARTLLAKRTRNAFQQRTHATPSEMRSIVRVLESNVELSLRRVLS